VTGTYIKVTWLLLCSGMNLWIVWSLLRGVR
jgi:hypothetical protein